MNPNREGERGEERWEVGGREVGQTGKSCNPDRMQKCEKTLKEVTNVVSGSWFSITSDGQVEQFLSL